VREPRERHDGEHEIHQAEPDMTPACDMIAFATGDTGMRELDHRSNDDIEVTLLWSARTDRVFVLVLERRTEALFHFEVAPAQALEAFHHPYAYAQDVHLQEALAA
jgi:hypothetical protein